MKFELVEYICVRFLSILIFLISATMVTSTSNQTNCTFPCLCLGISSYTLWQIYTNYSMYMTIDTSSCNYNRTPLYFTSMAGITWHYALSGYGGIYLPTRTSFTIYTQNLLNWNASYLMSLAASDTWNVNWFGLYN
jgi:hypothetical protein